MREEDDNNNTNDLKKTKGNALRWTVRSARRVQLAVRTSITSSVAKKAVFVDDDENSEVISISSTALEDNANIDQAMLGLYCLPDETNSLFQDRSLFERADSARQLKQQQSRSSIYDVSSLLLNQSKNQSSSYIPQDDWDPILDGGFRDSTEEERTKVLTEALCNYESSTDWQMALTREHNDTQPFDNDGESSEDVIDFGDFQSAEKDISGNSSTDDVDVVDPKSQSADREPRVEFALHTPPPTSKRPIEDERSIGSGTTFSTVGTVGLVKRIDELFSNDSSLDENDLCSALSNDFSTPSLLAQANDILARVAREQDGSGEDVPENDVEDDDSDATPKSRRRISYSTPSRQLTKEFAESKRISMELPVADLTSMHSRWTRRRQMECQANDSEEKADPENSLERLKRLLDDLPELYQIPVDKLDDGPVEANASTLRVLNSVPWGCIHLDEPASAPVEHELSVWDDFFAGQLSQLDSTLEGVQKIMAASVNPEKLDQANTLVHSCEQNLRLAKIYWDRSSRALEAAVAVEPDGSFNGFGILGNVHLLELWQQKEDFAELGGLLERLQSVTAQEDEIIRRIDTFDAKHSRAQDEYLHVVQLGRRLRDTLDGDLGSLDCLNELRDSRLTSILEERFWNRLKHLSQQSVLRVCRNREVPSGEYDSLIQAAFGLFEASHSNQVDCNATSLSAEMHAKADEESGWSKNIVEAMLYEAERCFAIALLEPLDAEDSAFVKDLRSLEQEIGTDWGDSAKLKTLTHNLVTIRFDFERSLCYLPRVMVRLCECLLDVLRGHVVFHQTHCSLATTGNSDENGIFTSPQGKAFMSSVADGLETAQTILWDKCESIIVHALKEYQNFSSKTQMFRTERGSIDDSVWERELQGLHVVYSAIECFMQFKSAFFGFNISCDKNLKVYQSQIFDVMKEIASEHLETLHIEAMTAMGRLLSRETWYLVNFNYPEESEKKCDPSATPLSSRQILFSSLASVIQKHKGLGTFYRLSPAGVSERLGESPECEFPFLRPRQPILFGANSTIHSFPPEGYTDNELISRMYDSIDSSLNASEDTHRIATQSIIDGLVEWVARLVLVSLKVPLVSEQVCAHLENVFDLYFTTVFRLCAGSRRNERIILGDDTSTAAFDSSTDFLPESRKRGSSPSAILRSFGHERRPSGKPPSIPFRTSVTISSTLDIEMCAPMPADLKETEKARRFIDRAQQELHGKVNLNRVDSWIGNQNAQDDPEEHACAASKIIERREAAAWSCLAVAGLAEVAFTTMVRYPVEDEASEYSNVKRLQDYVASVAEAVSILSRKASEVSCTRALSPFGFVKDIVQVGGEWEESKLHEQPNDYVETLCERVCLIWGFVAASGKLPQHLVGQVWARLQTAAYMTLLEGFSRVIHCSTEGRALMALDLASVSSNMRRDAVLERLESFDLPFTPPHVSPRQGKQYVDVYVKVYYYPQEDVLGWISNNCKYYRMNHMLSLLSSSGFGGRAQQSREMFERVKKLYETE
eukprot:scaffold3361_cov166-Amphora_coffeaeformis.AAC.7